MSLKEIVLLLFNRIVCHQSKVAKRLASLLQFTPKKKNNKKIVQLVYNDCPLNPVLNMFHRYQRERDGWFGPEIVTLKRKQ